MCTENAVQLDLTVKNDRFSTKQFFGVKTVSEKKRRETADEGLHVFDRRYGSL
jgi:hypothetical protein